MSAPDHWQSLKPETRMEMEKHARQLVRGSIIEDAAARFMAMCMAEAIGESKRRADLALTAPKVKAMVDAAKEAVEALDYSVSEIADLENTLSNYRQNWQPAAAALSVLRAALAALEGGDG